jgi:hypothetical protein
VLTLDWFGVYDVNSGAAEGPASKYVPVSEKHSCGFEIVDIYFPSLGPEVSSSEKFRHFETAEMASLSPKVRS